MRHFLELDVFCHSFDNFGPPAILFLFSDDVFPYIPVKADHFTVD